jgi:hypothetical protein
VRGEKTAEIVSGPLKFTFETGIGSECYDWSLRDIELNLSFSYGIVTYIFHILPYHAS